MTELGDFSWQQLSFRQSPYAFSAGSALNHHAGFSRRAVFPRHTAHSVDCAILASKRHETVIMLGCRFKKSRRFSVNRHTSAGLPILSEFPGYEEPATLVSRSWVGALGLAKWTSCRVVTENCTGNSVAQQFSGINIMALSVLAAFAS